jgi:hypothetical protein
LSTQYSHFLSTLQLAHLAVVEGVGNAAPPPLYVANHDEALAVAQTLVAPGRRLYLVKIDSNDWVELPG